MIEQIGHLNMDYMVRLAHDPEHARRELDRLQEYTSSRGVQYAGNPVPVPLKPHFVNPRQRQVLQYSVSGVCNILERFIRIFLKDDHLQKMWGVSKEELELFQVDPGYDRAIQVARLDGFLHDYSLKFLEFNCDSPGGTGYVDIVHEGFLELFERNGLSHHHSLSASGRLDILSRTLADAYAEWQRNGHSDHPEKPFVIVTDWRDVGTISDIRITIERMQQQGMDTVFADPRDLEFRAGDGLYFGDRRVDLVYKRVIVRELLNEPNARALADAYRAGTVCMVNCPRSVIVGNKKILAALRQPHVFDQLTRDEKKLVRDHVPWTEIMQDAKVDFQGFTVGLRDFVLDNKDRLVLKAAESYGGKDVLIGFETPSDVWAKTVDDHILDGTWVVQELVPIPKEPFPVLRQNTVELSILNVNINPLAFAGKYAGSFSRVSERNVINVSYGGGLTPTIAIEPQAVLDPEGAP